MPDHALMRCRSLRNFAFTSESGPPLGRRERNLDLRKVVSELLLETENKNKKLHIVMDKGSFMKLQKLKSKLEASTESEVIRRALKAYELFEPDDDANDISLGPNLDNASGMDEHLYIRIPSRMKKRLDDEYQTSGRSYGEQVRQALRVFTQLIREMESCKEDLAMLPSSNMKGGSNARLLKLAAVV